MCKMYVLLHTYAYSICRLCGRERYYLLYNYNTNIKVKVKCMISPTNLVMDIQSFITFAWTRLQLKTYLSRRYFDFTDLTYQLIFLRDK